MEIPHCVLCLKMRTGLVLDLSKSSSRSRSCCRSNIIFPDFFRVADSTVSRRRELPSKEITDDLELLLRVMPPHIREALHRQSDLKNLIEVVMDLGRQPEARFPSRAVYLGESNITREDLDYVTHRVGAFTL